MRINHKLSVHAYKFDGCLYRTFEFPRVIYENNEYIILDLQTSRVISQAKNKKFYHSSSKKDSLWVFFKDKWYNLFVTINEKGHLIYYFNVASPFIYEEDTIKYIDLDLDIRVIDVNTQIELIKVLDEKEFEEHARSMLYPKKLVDKAIEVKEQLILSLQNKAFQQTFNQQIFEKLHNILNRGKKKKHHG